jgi:hypothetical protein
MEIAAHLFTVLGIITSGFQIALAAGAPWGHLTMGGRFPGQLPSRMRGVAVLSAVLLIAFVLVAETRAGVMLIEWQPISRVLVWGVVAYCSLGVLANAITPSRGERMIWLPVVLLLLICSVIVATG